MFESAEAQGYFLKIGSIEGELPFKWTLRDISLKFDETNALHIDTMRVRFSILHLLKKQIAISYFHVDNAELFFRKKEEGGGAALVCPWTFSIKSAKIAHLLLHNTETDAQMICALQGSAFLKRKGRLFR
ncbi:MAG: hypothetical protein LVR00_01215 [Rhabdochlamydiaceae bacterium]|jgi:hypothetical protein